MNTSQKSHEDAVVRFYEMLHDITIGMLTILRPDGTLHTRPMVTLFREPRGDPWFFTSEDTEKVAELAEDRHVAVAYSDPQKQWYASVSGRARLEHDRKLMHQLWAPGLLAWFPRGPDDHDLVLLRAKVTSAEYWDAPSNTMIEIIAGIQAGLGDAAPSTQMGGHEKL